MHCALNYINPFIDDNVNDLKTIDFGLVPVDSIVEKSIFIRNVSNVSFNGLFIESHK